MGKLGIRFNKRAAYSGRAYSLVENLAEIAQDHGMEIFTCAEEIDFSKVGVPPGRCIDGELLYELWSLHGHDKKDPAQRASCLCAVAKDIGVNDTCIHGCPYCYSTRSLILARRRYSEHDPNSPVIWGSGRPLSEAEKADQLKVRLL